MKVKNRIKARKWRLIATTILTIFFAPMTSVPAQQSANVPAPQITETKSKQDKNAHRVKDESHINIKSVGLKTKDLHLVNQGRFGELIDSLSPRVSSGSSTNREPEWLAFAYLYSQKCEELKQLASSLATGSNASTSAASTTVTVVTNPDTTAPATASTIVLTFSMLCEKKLDQAEKLLQTIPASAMNDAFVNYAFATLAGKQGKPQVAITYTKRAVELAPDFAWGYRTIAFLQEKWLNQIQEAQTNYARALAIEPRLSEATANLIGLYLGSNKFDQAIAVARCAIKHDSHNSMNYFRLADIYLRQWRLQEAAEQLRKAIALDSKNSEYHRLLASILQRQDEMEAAIAEEKLAVDCSKNKSANLVDLAAMEISAGKQEAAVAHLEEALDADANNMNAAAALTNLLVQMKRFDELAMQLNKCAAKLPKNETIRLHLGDALAAAGQTDKAIDSYKEAANLNPNDPEPHNRIAAILAAQKDYKNAAKEYTRSLNINSNSVPNLVALGVCEAQMDDYLKAEAAFVTALALHQLTQPADSRLPPTRVEIIRGLATLLFKEGRYADAASQFVSLCEMDKDAETKNLNNFMYAQAVSLRDLSKESFKQLEDAYANLSNTEKDNQKINFIDTLLRSNHYDQALSLLNEIAKIGARTGASATDTTPSPTSASDPNSASSPSLIPEPAIDWLKDPFYYICLSRAYAGKGDLVKAEEAARQAIAVCDKEKSPHSDAFCQLGEVLFAKGDLHEAEKNANKALDVNAKAFRAHVLLGNVAMKHHEAMMHMTNIVLTDSQLNSAIEAANKALEIDPYFIDAYLFLAKAQTTKNDLKAALITYRKAADLYPGLVQTHESLLAVLKKLGSKDEIRKEEATIAQLKSRH